MTTKDIALFWDKLKIKLEMTENITKFETRSACYDHKDPDLWYSEGVEKGTRGGPTKEQMELQVQRSYQALIICSSCPTKSSCYEEGMRKENLDEGIWGGTMAGERLLTAGEPILSSDRKNKVSFAKKMRARYGYL
jgi:hypothetical protein